MIGSIINFISSIINYGASENVKDLANVMKKTDTNLRIEENNKAINKGKVDTIAGKLHEFGTLLPKKEEKEEEKIDA